MFPLLNLTYIYSVKFSNSVNIKTTIFYGKREKKYTQIGRQEGFCCCTSAITTFRSFLYYLLHMRITQRKKEEEDNTHSGTISCHHNHFDIYC